MQPKELSTARLTLRRTRVGDARPLFAYTGSVESSRYLQRGVHTSVEATAAFLAKWCSARWDSATDAFAWVIADRASDVPIGTFVLIRSGHVVEVHFGIAATHAGQGLATEALRAVVAWLRAVPGIQRICTSCDVENVAVHAVLRKAGFINEGLLRAHAVLPAFGPTARDCYSFALAPT